jgi:hypothetical protein
LLGGFVVDFLFSQLFSLDRLAGLLPLLLGF